MARYFLGVDVGASKSHALVTDQDGRPLGLGKAGPGNWEVVGYQRLSQVLVEITSQALAEAEISIDQLAGAGFGLAGYDWPSQREAHLNALHPLALSAPFEIYNDTLIGLVAGASQGWGVAVVAGTGCNCRGRDQNGRQGRTVGGWGHWSGETAGGSYLVLKMMRAVAQAWTRQGPPTALTQALVEACGAASPADLVEGMALGRHGLHASLAPLVFQAAQGEDPAACTLLTDMGQLLGDMALAVIRQLALQELAFEVVLVGGLYDGGPLMVEAMKARIQVEAPRAKLVRLAAPPVVGGVLLGMEQAGLAIPALRQRVVRAVQKGWPQD